MKTTYIRIVTLVALATMLTASVYADAAAYAKIIKERDAVLSQILSEQERMRNTGTANEEAIFSAQIALYSFRRDTASTVSERIKNQELIVAAHDKRLAEIKKQAQAGAATNMDTLLATDGLLQAKQILEELKMGEKKS